MKHFRENGRIFRVISSWKYAKPFGENVSRWCVKHSLFSYVVINKYSKLRITTYPKVYTKTNDPQNPQCFLDLQHFRESSFHLFILFHSWITLLTSLHFIPGFGWLFELSPLCASVYLTVEYMFERHIWSHLDQRSCL